MAFVSEVIQFIAGVRAVVAGTPRTAASVNAGLSDLASRTKWLNERLYQLLLGAPLTISAVNTTTDRLTVTGHGIPANTAVQVFAANGGALPGGLAAATVYYVDVVDADTIKLSATSGPGAAVDLTAGFVGDCYAQIIPDWLSTLLIADATYGAGKLSSLVVFLAGAQTVSGAKTFADITVSGVTYYKLASRSLGRTVPCTFVDISTGLSYRMPCAIPATKTVGAMIDLPHGGSLTAMTVTIDPANVGVLPGTMPKVTVLRIEASGASTDIGNQTDTSADFTAFSAVHEIAVTGMTEVIDTTLYTYRVDVRGSGDDVVTVLRVKPTITVGGLRHWA